jgi:steroid 5-alpha reductase family enzyme
LPLSNVFAIVAFILFLYILIWFLLSIFIKRADLADIAWGPGFILVVWSSFFIGQISVNGLIVNLLITIWGIRLCMHISFRNRNRKEDFRYENLKRRWSRFFHLRLFLDVFLLQGMILYVVSLPVVWIHTHTQKVPVFVLVTGVFIWLSGFVIETIADRQLIFFRKDLSNKGNLLKEGLWSCSRHPNYLGELIQWWAIWLIAVVYPLGWVFVISPLLITFLIVNVSGIKPLEEKMKDHPDFKDYAEKVPSLIPYFLGNAPLWGFGLVLFMIYLILR